MRSGFLQPPTRLSATTARGFDTWRVDDLFVFMAGSTSDARRLAPWGPSLRIEGASSEDYMLIM